jgi:release factor glutamine methyltransferase
LSEFPSIKRGEGPWPSGNGEVAVKLWFVRRISKGVEESERSAVTGLCLDYVSKKTKGQRIVDDFKYSESLLDKLAVFSDELNDSRPVQYVLGEANFDGLDITVNGSVLIPRPETEELVHRVASELEAEFNGDLLDIGTGSGCIALALKHRLKKAKVVGVDVCDDALEVARCNSSRLNLDVRFECVDILDSFPSGDFDAVVSNPPYIPTQESVDMEKRVVSFEPGKALFVPNDDPLLFYKRIVEVCGAGLLNLGGLLALEAHRDYVAEVAELLERSALWNKVEVITDLQGNDRHVIARRSVT